MSCKKCLLLICKILRLFVKTLAAEDKHSLLNRDNLTQPIQMKVSQKQKNFCESFCKILKSSLNFEHFARKDHPHS